MAVPGLEVQHHRCGVFFMSLQAPEGLVLNQNRLLQVCVTMRQMPGKKIESQNHRIFKAGKDLEDHPVQLSTQDYHCNP